MTTRIYNDTPEGRERAARAVAAGGVVAFRTDTFYGLGSDPFDARALEAINSLKGRDGKPILVLVSDEGAAARLLAAETPLFRALARAHWPGPLTLVAAAAPGVTELLTAGTGTIGVRLPADEAARRLVRECGGALTATSANTAGRPPARTAAEVAGYFPEGLSLVVDGGETRAELPSTVLDVSGTVPRLIRVGAVSRAQVEATLRGLNLRLEG
ncbi:MAG TPA: L-threonylcarbamoyladenylate synthase [Pyrinomonadaceae bacterium]|nr:L-threonylcarbamoyladenylate synthase [Pyrinomonadaceae bacterium]